MTGNMNQGTCSSSTSWAVKVLMKSIARTSSSSPTPYFLRTKKLYIYLVGFPTHRLAQPAPLESTPVPHPTHDIDKQSDPIDYDYDEGYPLNCGQYENHARLPQHFIDFPLHWVVNPNHPSTDERPRFGAEGESWGSCPSICLSD